MLSYNAMKENQLKMQLNQIVSFGSSVMKVMSKFTDI